MLYPYLFPRAELKGLAHVTQLALCLKKGKAHALISTWNLNRYTKLTLNT